MVRHIAIPLVVLATLGCKRAQSEPPIAPGEESVTATESEGLAMPKGCSNVEECAELGTLALLNGDVQSVEMLAYACANGSPVACQNLSAGLRSGGLPEDMEVAHAAAMRGCDLGNAAACIDLGVDESVGYGGAPPNYGSALDRFTLACEAGEAKGCRYAGVLFHEGSAGAPDPAAALQLFAVGCELGDSDSCFNSGVLIVDGVGGGIGLDVAASYMARACELGDQDGCAAVDKITAAAQAQTQAKTPKVQGANLQIGSATVDGFTVESLECRIDSGGSNVLGNMALLAVLAERKAKIDKCGAKGTMVDVTWTASGGKITKAEGVGSEGECVAKVLEKLPTPVDGECAGRIVLGS